MDPRFGTLSHITLNRPKIYYVLKISSKAGMVVHFAVLYSVQEVVLWTDFKYFKKNLLKKLCLVCSEIPLGEESCRVETGQNDLQFVSVWLFFFFCMMQLFTEKIWEQTLICYVFNIVNNCKKKFFCIFFIFYFFTIYCMSQ